MDVRGANAADAAAVEAGRSVRRVVDPANTIRTAATAAPDPEGEEGLFVPSHPSAVIARTTAIAAPYMRTP